MISKSKATINLDINKFIREWNVRYPYDRWWRKKYNIPFGSEQHRKANFIDMIIEFKEEVYFQKLNKESAEDKEMELEVDKIISSENKGVKTTIKLSKKEIDDEFDNLNLNEFN